MSYRKRRLIVIQLILLSLAVVLFYLFYYQNVDKDLTSQTTEMEIDIYYSLAQQPLTKKILN